MEGSSSVRRGAWNKFEDDLLKACIQHYGEGKWHLVPQRAGLNRCRKSCRLRWLNYLKPNIKRGNFSEDEVDLMMRLHKLLGNRWSLIAGRLPGRTSNDVKNYWNTYLRRKVNESQEKDKKMKEQEVEEKTQHEVIKPVPRTFSSKTISCKGKIIEPHNNGSYSKGEAGAASSGGGSENWWETLLEDKENNNNTCFFDGGDGPLDHWVEELASINASDFLIEDKNWTDFLDNNFWES
ncbi:hypothetical protein RJT34_18306 [Clitoria ternatea]|uniref:Uncharacterized protein n=1 Tax=Clitoria ternatea TaxID=43366 RepID=A0AAN9PFB3_CLITE